MKTWRGKFLATASNRSRGHRSPLDKLPGEATQELARRCYGSDTLREIADWLRENHGLKISRTSISDWWKRRIAAGFDSVGKSPLVAQAFNFEITITAPGAERIAVQFRPAPGETKGEGAKG